jgi:plasmid stability protein
VKNVTISLDDETHRRARIRAAELGTSLSALVKDYLNGLAGGDAPTAPSAGVREMPMTYTAPPPTPAKLPPRKLGQMKGEIWYADDWDVWPEDIQKAFDSYYEDGDSMGKP